MVAEEYVQALQKALEGRDVVPLLTLLDAGHAVPGAIAPIVAAVLRTKYLPAKSGNSVKLTARDDASIRWWFDHAPYLYPAGSKFRVGLEHQQLATMFGVSEKTIERSLGRTKI